jgi:hypothetical protein
VTQIFTTLKFGEKLKKRLIKLLSSNYGRMIRGR